MNVTYDRELHVALGTGRKTKRWKNKTLRWSELLDKLGSFVVTNETMAQYKAMSRDRQAEVKDVGGFVGGYCQDGSRKNVVSRSVLCLDADFADADLWPDWQMLSGCAAAIYSTHKHTPDAPRLRLVIPLSRDVTPDEYAAIGRKVAADLGIDKFDDTTYAPDRLMYWPSRSSDGEQIFEHQDGEMLDPDAILTRYDDWRDVSAWPTSSRVAEAVRKTAKTQGDPLAKPGMIGAFCRTYTVQDAIAKYLPDVYLPCDDPGRYTYAGGSTAAGVVVYDDRYVYSHHATDPASGRLCNAWDMVRLHLYGEQDKDKAEDTAPTRLPSYKAMMVLANADDVVRVTAIKEHIPGDVDGDFTNLDDEDSKEWIKQIAADGHGVPKSTIANVRLILDHDPKIKGRLAWNELEAGITVRGALPWDTDADETKPRGWTDGDDSELRRYLEGYGVTGRDKITDGLVTAARARSYHPVREFIRAAEWDGVPRVDRLLVRYLGAEDTEYTRAVTRKTLTAAVARVFRPGVKFDYMLTIRGKQGIGKSRLTARLAGEWFSDTFIAVAGKDAYEQLRNVWIMEVGELAGMRKQEAETIKQYISKREDRYRPAYARTVQTFPRQCIFVGTTNESEFLRDTTGNRRFWVVDTPNSDARASIEAELTDEIIHQIWAEAYHYYQQGEPLYLTGEVEAEATRIQEAFAETDDRVGLVKAYLDRALPEDWETKDTYERREWLQSSATGTVERKTVCRLEVWCEVLDGRDGQYKRGDGKDVHALIEACGWRYTDKRTRFGSYGLQRAYVRRR